MSVQRLSARARLDESRAAIAQAQSHAAAGDESWDEWLAEYQRGDALILRLDLTLAINDGTDHVVSVTTEGFFVENHVHPPKVEQQIAELASGDFPALAAELARRGHEVHPYELGELYVHVELDEEVRRRLAGSSRVKA